MPKDNFTLKVKRSYGFQLVKVAIIMLNMEILCFITFNIHLLIST